LDRGKGVPQEELLAEFGITSEDFARLGRTPLDTPTLLRPGAKRGLDRSSHGHRRSLPPIQFQKPVPPNRPDGEEYIRDSYDPEREMCADVFLALLVSIFHHKPRETAARFGAED
jgi:hypothetical protein